LGPWAISQATVNQHIDQIRPQPFRPTKKTGRAGLSSGPNSVSVFNDFEESFDVYLQSDLEVYPSLSLYFGFPISERLGPDAVSPLFNFFDNLDYM